MVKVVLFANHNNGYNITKYLISQADTKIVKVVVYDDIKNQWWESVKQLAIANKLDFTIYKNDKTLYQILNKVAFDILLSVSWRGKIFDNIISLAKIGAVNFHNSFLPKYKGSYANSWAIINGEKKTGVTLHWMTNKLDSGDIIYQKEIPIYSWDTASDLWHRQNRAYLQIFKKMWPKVMSWKKLGQPQKSQSSFYSIKDFKKTNKINLKKNTNPSDFINFLRGKTFDPYFKNAYFIDTQTKKKIYVSIKLIPEK